MINTIVVVGAQWGDEGKGKIVDVLSQQADVIIRWSGGDNAGHTVNFNHKNYKLNLIPSGVFNPHAIKLINQGCVINLEKLVAELKYLQAQAVLIENFYISSDVDIILPYHIELDIWSDKTNQLGTTKRGIGFCYQDKIARSGIKIYDLFDEHVFLNKLTKNLQEKTIILKYLYNHETKLNVHEIFTNTLNYFKQIKDLVMFNTSIMINQWIKEGKKVIFEGAQGSLLDINYGTYPYVTSANTIGSAVCGVNGVAPNLIRHMMGVGKAYNTRVGEGPFPTEIHDESLVNIIRTKGNEYGVVTGRKRRIGLFDMVAFKHACLVSGFNTIAVTLLDVLSGLPTVKICISYTLEGTIIDYMPSNSIALAKCHPNYIEMDGWTETLDHIREYDQLPSNAQLYLEKIASLANMNIEMISVGKQRDQIIFIKKIFDN